MCLAVPGELIERIERDGLPFGKVRFGGVLRKVCLAYQPDARPGDFVLVHVGFAIGTIDREAAARTWETLREIGELTDLVEEGDGIPG